MYNEQERQVAMATSNTKLPGTPICYRVAREIGIKGAALDFGCGKHKRHVHNLSEAGATRVVAYDFHFPESKAEAFAEKYDCVVASNVINVQSSLEGLRHTLEEIAGRIKTDGFAIVNYPADPRKMAPEPLTVTEMVNELRRAFVVVERVDKALSGNTPVFVLRNKK